MHGAAPFWKSSGTVGTGSAKRTCPFFNANKPHPSKFKPQDRSAADRSLTCPYRKTGSLWKSSSTAGTGSAKRTCPPCQCKIQIQTPGSQRCGQVTDLSLPKNWVIMEIIQGRSPPLRRCRRLPRRKSMLLAATLHAATLLREAE